VNDGGGPETTEPRMRRRSPQPFPVSKLKKLRVCRQRAGKGQQSSIFMELVAR